MEILLTRTAEKGIRSTSGALILNVLCACLCLCGLFFIAFLQQKDTSFVRFSFAKLETGTPFGAGNYPPATLDPGGNDYSFQAPSPQWHLNTHSKDDLMVAKGKSITATIRATAACCAEKK